MIDTLTAFAQDVQNGLNKSEKTLPSKYFYDEIGDALFVKIMDSPEYYLTYSEMEIFEERTDELVSLLSFKSKFDLIELGAGDGSKTIHLLKALPKANFKYIPVDISSNALELLHERMTMAMPDLEIETRNLEYFDALKTTETDNPKLVLFLGSSIGNMLDDRARDFLNQLSGCLRSGDKVLLGIDLKKSPSVVLPAYNDAQGYTRDFNLNLLHRINNDLDANFDLDKFEHAPRYDEEQGIALSYLRSKVNQTVTINALETNFSFTEGEVIHTEISRKYDRALIESLIQDTGMKIQAWLTDSKNYFADVILEKV